MIWLKTLLAALGWRGMAAAALGAALAAAPAYKLGAWREAAAAAERCARTIAQREAALLEASHERIRKAMEARRRAALGDDGGAGDGRLHDDGFRRD